MPTCDRRAALCASHPMVNIALSLGSRMISAVSPCASSDTQARRTTCGCSAASMSCTSHSRPRSDRKSPISGWNVALMQKPRTWRTTRRRRESRRLQLRVGHSVARRIGFSLLGQETFCFSKSGVNRFDRQATSASKFWTPLRALRICGHCPVSLPPTSMLDLSRPSA
jgi:hypothetical protein